MPKVDDSRVVRVGVAEVASRLDRGSNVLILDVRDPVRYAEGHIPSARRVHLPDVDPFEPTTAFAGYSALIVYGENPGSGTAMALAKRLMQARHKNVQLMEEGYERWRSDGHPVVASPEGE